MIVGIPKEIKNHEYRVGLTPESVAELVQDGQSVVMETQAGAGIGASDEEYMAAGATIAQTAKEIFDTAEMINCLLSKICDAVFVQNIAWGREELIVGLVCCQCGRRVI